MLITLYDAKIYDEINTLQEYIMFNKLTFFVFFYVDL
jgi:hypothetical protein